MINLLIKNEGYVPLWLELPRKRMFFANKLREIGVNIPPSELKCNLNKDGISVKLWGNSDFEKKLVSVLHDRCLSSVNKIVETLLFMPWEEKQKFEKDVLTNRLKSYADILDRLRLCQDTAITDKFYFPLTVRMCEYDENGYFDESSENEYDGRFAARFEREIVDGFNRYTQHDRCNMVEYFDGSNGAQSKLKSMDWGFEEHDSELFGVVKVELIEKLTADSANYKRITTELAAKLDEMKPKVSYCDKILQNPDTIPVTLIAKDYGMSAIKFNILLHDLNVQFRVGGTWELYQEYAGHGYTHSSVNEFGNMHTCWTQRGRMLLYEFLKKRRA